MRKFQINGTVIRVERSHQGLDFTLGLPERALRRALRDLEEVKKRLVLVPAIGPLLRAVTAVQLQVLEELAEEPAPAPEARH